MLRPLSVMTIVLLGGSLIGCSRSGDDPQQLIDATEQVAEDQAFEELKAKMETQLTERSSVVPEELIE